MFLLVAGGSGSGKSEYAEQRVVSFSSNRDTQKIYIATMIPYGTEGHQRVKRHQAQRAGRGFRTVERYTDLLGIELPDSARTQTGRRDAPGKKALSASRKCDVLLECMSNLLANEMFDSRGSHETAVDAILCGIDRLREISRNLVVVTNDVFLDGMTYDHDTERYIRNLGQINQRLADRADEVVEVVYSVPVVHKKNEVKM